MYGVRELTAKEKEYFISLFKYMIDELTSGRRSEFDLSSKGINPIQTLKLMRDLGYPVKRVDGDSCEQENWYYFKNTHIWLYSNGLAFELTLNGGKTFRLEN